MKIFLRGFQSALLILAILAYQEARSFPLQSSAYAVETLSQGETIEYRFKLNNRHFGSLIDDQGAFAFRPHPGCDANGWGTTWYAQPFLPGATLAHTIIDRVQAAPDGIQVHAFGKVSRYVSETYGDWQISLQFAYNLPGQIATATGHYTITLDAPLDDTTGDLNLYKIASNYLDDVPLLSDGSGDTGDMKAAVVMKTPGVAWFTWIPPDQPAHYPTDRTDFLSVDVIGQFNNVDTASQGYAPIAPAFKPGMKVNFTSQRQEMTFGGAYEVDESQHFWADNVGIVALIPRPSAETAFGFEVLLESAALETCTYLPLVRR